MRIKSVDILNGGEVLAESILTHENVELIPKGTAIKEDYIPLIQALGIDALKIEDPYKDLEKPNMIIQSGRFEEIVSRVQKVMESHIYHTNRSLREFEVIANEIVKEIDGVPEQTVIDVNEHTANLYEHTVMVTLLGVTIAKKLNLDRKKRYDIALGCLLHDIGIRYITVKYNNHDWSKSDPMEAFEFKKHTILGYSALEEEVWVPDITRKMVLSHHERLDGSGFPMHQKNREIECKIIQVCDVFDCCISGMECRRMSVQEASDRISAEAGHWYEKKIVYCLISMIAKYPVGTTVKTNDGMEGVVISQTPDPENPIIMIFNAEGENQMRNLMLEEAISILQVV